LRQMIGEACRPFCSWRAAVETEMWRGLTCSLVTSVRETSAVMASNSVIMSKEYYTFITEFTTT
jgi:hypothetical protein